MLTWQLLWAQALFRRAQLKALVTMHSIEENYGGHLSATEINIIGGALDLTNKTAAHGMTPLDKVCCTSSSALLVPGQPAMVTCWLWLLLVVPGHYSMVMCWHWSVLVSVSEAFWGAT